MKRSRHVPGVLGSAERRWTDAEWIASERRDEERRALRPPTPSTSYSDAWRCVTCRGEWTEAGSAARGYCTRCGTSRPAGVPPAAT